MLQYLGEDKGGHDAVRNGAIQRIRCGGTHVVIGQRRLYALQRMVREMVAWHEEGGGGCIKRWGCLKRGVAWQRVIA